MKLLYSGIHKNIGFLIQHIGGYDQEYHITKLSEKLNVSRNDISKIFNYSRRSNLNHYIELLENGMDIVKVLNMINKDNDIATRNYRTAMSVMSGIVLNSGFNRML